MYENNSILVIIPARGGSKGIPRKNVKFLNGNPLISYSIKTCLFSKYVDKTIVSTDDEEIAAISRFYNVDEVIMRPASLAEDITTLDPVIFHAFHEYCKINNEKFDVVITIQPTSPLLKTSSLDEAIRRFFEKEASSLISVKPVSHLFWEKKGEKYSPYYPERLNRQELSPVFFETGSIVISKADLITEKARIFEPLEIYETSGTEDIDIDSYLDWAVVEKIMKRKKIFMRVDGDFDIGMGHIYRNITLASNLLDHDIYFIMDKKRKLGIEKVSSLNYKILKIENEQDFFNLIEKESPEIVMIDILDTSIELMEKISTFDVFIVSFEDLGAGLDYADIVINAVYQADKNNQENVVSGYKYLCLRDEFFLVPFKTVQKEIDNILIAFGGTDQNNLSLETLKVLESFENTYFEITIIVGLAYKNLENLKNYAKTLQDRGLKIEILRDVKLMSKHMHKADIAITSNGRTVFEIASLGVPCISIAQNERETHHTFVEDVEGVIYLGRADDHTSERLKESLELLMTDYQKRLQMNESLARYDLRKGVKRVLRLIFDEYEKKYPSNLLNR